MTEAGCKPEIGTGACPCSPFWQWFEYCEDYTTLGVTLAVGFGWVLFAQIKEVLKIKPCFLVQTPCSYTGIAKLSAVR